MSPWNIDALKELEQETGKNIYNILQLRLHKSIIDLKEKINKAPKKKYNIDLQYITSRGNWYYTSWKGNYGKSGGIVLNIGVHFFDMLIWIFGSVKDIGVDNLERDKASGFLELENAEIKWKLSIDANSLPDHCKDKNIKTYRSIKIDDKEIEFSDGFTDLHTKSYQHILEGNGWGINEAKPSIDVIYKIMTYFNKYNK